MPVPIGSSACAGRLAAAATIPIAATVGASTLIVLLLSLHNGLLLTDAFPTSASKTDLGASGRRLSLKRKFSEQKAQRRASAFRLLDHEVADHRRQEHDAHDSTY